MENELETMKQTIEKMGKKQHIEVLKILKQNNTIKLNENKSGIYINLSFLPKETIQELLNYIEYIHDQETSLETLETEKEKYKTTFFADDDE